MISGRTVWGALALCAGMLAAGCGSGGNDAGGVEDPTLAEDVTPTTCQAAFSPEKVADGQDCTPQSGEYCPQGVPVSVLQSEVLACDGVTVTQSSASAEGLNGDLLVIHRTGVTSFESVYLALHYVGSRLETFANVARLAELARARNTLVIVPAAPSLLSLNVTARWPVSAALGDPIDQYVDYLTAVVDGVSAQFDVAGKPVYVAGLSNGAVMAYHYACRSGVASAVLAVSGDYGDGVLTTCSPQRALGTVIVHGTLDLLTPYEGLIGLTASIPEIHEFFLAQGACGGTESIAAMAKPYDDLQVNIAYGAVCADRSKHYLVTVELGGHSWPGHAPADALIDLTTIGLFGLRTANFDATLQGYDLLRLADPS